MAVRKKLGCDRMAAQNGGFSQLSSIDTADTVSLGVSSVVMALSKNALFSAKKPIYISLF